MKEAFEAQRQLRLVDDKEDDDDEAAAPEPEPTADGNCIAYFGQ